MRNPCCFFMKDDIESNVAAYMPIFLDALKHRHVCKAQASVYKHKSNIYEFLFTKIGRRCLQCISDSMYRLNLCHNIRQSHTNKQDTVLHRFAVKAT